MASDPSARRLLRPVDRRHDHVRGGGGQGRPVTVLIYGDYLCPYCRRLKGVLERLRTALGERMVYVFRHFPNERAHPGAEQASVAAEAAGRQGKYFEMHDAIYGHNPPIDREVLLQLAASIGLDMPRFERDLADPELRERVERDLEEGRRNGVTATPTIFIDGYRYDGAWDFHSMLEALDRPVGARVQRTARAFANLPSSAGLALLIAAVAALAFANSPLAGWYARLVATEFVVGPDPGGLRLSFAEWCGEGLLAVFFLILGLEIRREMKSGALADWRAAVAPGLAALGGVAAAAAAYLLLNPGSTSVGWAAPADTGIAFTLGIMALFGARAPAGLKVFVAAYAVADDMLAILILAVFFPRAIHPEWLLSAAGALAVLALLSRWRVYAVWPYLVVTAGLWLALHRAGISGAISGVALAAFLPPRPAPRAGPLLAQAATALAELEHSERELKARGDGRRIDQEPIWDWASRNLSAAAERLLAPAERVERAMEPWSTYLVLPLFAFTAAGVPLAADIFAPHAPGVLLGVVLGLAVAKPLGIVLATWLATRARVGVFPQDASPMAFVGAALLCGIGDPLSLLIVDQAFGSQPYGAVAKVGVLAGSGLAAALGAAVLALSHGAVTEVEPAAEAAQPVEAGRSGLSPTPPGRAKA